MTDLVPAPRLNWTMIVSIVGTLVGVALALGGLFVTVGAWRGGLDARIDGLDIRMAKAERNLETYVPMIVAMNRDLAFLAERARRDDERRDRGQSR